ncbi:MAG: NUDIX domain-containing protein [Dactylosporangium sp.]|nr:NUDIX domain-containing protein [Dactylosporangium sp.]NNJ62717.1 NUDIX domain-containing protein [Dactylosporangium sp.]
MTGIRHATASAVVLDDHDRVLLIHHNKLGQWLHPGGHLDPNEDPAQAALREVREETGIEAVIVTDPLPTFTGVATLPAPLMITEMDVVDAGVGPHRHIDHVYVCRPVRGELTPQLAEVGGCQWVPIGEVATLDTPEDLPELIRYAAAWAKPRW